jgi:hypothetical protein
MMPSDSELEFFFGPIIMGNLKQVVYRVHREARDERLEVRIER